jgi:hypothetical protein
MVEVEGEAEEMIGKYCWECEQPVSYMIVI